MHPLPPKAQYPRIYVSVWSYFLLHEKPPTPPRLDSFSTMLVSLLPSNKEGHNVTKTILMALCTLPYPSHPAPPLPGPGPDPPPNRAHHTDVKIMHGQSGPYPHDPVTPRSIPVLACCSLANLEIAQGNPSLPPSMRHTDEHHVAMTLLCTSTAPSACTAPSMER
jgi:hypothetical protein